MLMPTEFWEDWAPRPNPKMVCACVYLHAYIYTKEGNPIIIVSDTLSNMVH